MMVKEKAKSTRTRMTPVMIVMLVILCLYVVSLVLPFLWAFLASFKTRIDYLYDPAGLPQEWVWNYGTVFSKFKHTFTNASGRHTVMLPQLYLNSLLYALGSAITASIVPCVTAYLCARFRYKFSAIMYNIVIITMILPIVGNMPSQIIFSRAFGLYDHIWGMWIINASFLGLYFLVFYNVFKALPKDFTEAAKIDGAGNMQIFLRVVLPVVRNTLLTVILVKFIDFWNDYQTPLMYVPSGPTVSYVLFLLKDSTEKNMSAMPMRMAAAMLVFVPIAVLFLIFQKRLLGSLMVGGIKG